MNEEIFDSKAGQHMEELAAQKAAQASKSALMAYAAFGPQPHRIEPRYETPTGGDFEERGTETQITALYAALAKARGEFGPISKSREVKIAGNANYKFAYAPLEELLAATVPALSSNGLVIMMPFTLKNDVCAQNVIIAHASGGRLVYRFVFSPLEDEKKFGGQTTYLQRYCYRSVLMLAADADLDDIPTAGGAAEASTRAAAPKTQQAGRQEPNRNPPASAAPTGPAAATEQARLDMLKLAKTAGLKTLSELARFIWATVSGGQEFVLGDPVGRLMTAEQIEKVMLALQNKIGTP